MIVYRSVAWSESSRVSPTVMEPVVVMFPPNALALDGNSTGGGVLSILLHYVAVRRHEQPGGTSMKHYVVISSDCHAGPNSPVYRDFLDPQYLDDFDDELAERQRAHRRAPRGRLPA